MNTQQIYQTESNQQSKKSEEGFMQLRHSVFEKRLDLNLVLKPLELFILDLIIFKTIKWNTKEAKFTIEWLKEKTQQHHSEIYRALKSLETQGIIYRHKIKHGIILGLNEEYFGGLLTKEHEATYQERKNNLRNVCETPTSSVGNSHIECVELTHKVCESPTQSMVQLIDIISKNTSLKNPIKETNLKNPLKESQNTEAGTGESYTLQREREPKQIRTKEEHFKMVVGQIEQLNMGVAF